MTSKSKKVARPTSGTPKEDASPVGSAPGASGRIHVEVDPGTGDHITFEFKITVQRRAASGFAPVVNARETSSPELWDEQSPDQSPDDPEFGPWVYSVITGEPVRMRRPKRGWRKFGRRR
ncbi:MAG: hypothetical protein WCF81_17930 [Roseiarcus sp.]